MQEKFGKLVMLTREEALKCYKTSLMGKHDQHTEGQKVERSTDVTTRLRKLETKVPWGVAVEALYIMLRQKNLFTFSSCLETCRILALKAMG